MGGEEEKGLKMREGEGKEEKERLGDDKGGGE